MQAHWFVSVCTENKIRNVYWRAIYISYRNVNDPLKTCIWTIEKLSNISNVECFR